MAKVKKDKFKVSLDKEKKILYADVTVYVKPEWLGVAYYSTTEVVAELYKQGYKIKGNDCIKPNKSVLRSDNGNGKVFTGRWSFKYSDPAANKKEKVAPKKSVEKPKETTVRKKSNTKQTPKTVHATKETKKETTKDILEAYKKEIN